MGQIWVPRNGVSVRSRLLQPLVMVRWLMCAQIHVVEGLQHLCDLRVLNLAGNCIEHVRNLSGLTSLVELNLRRNRIQTAVSWHASVEQS